jgi:hypothetical protein
MEECCGPLAVEIFPGNTAISAPLLPRVRELSLAHVQRSIFLIMEQSSGPLTVEIFPGKHCDFSFYLAKRAGARSVACAEVKFNDYGIELWSLDSRNISRKALGFQHLSCQESENSVWSVRREKSFLIMEQSFGPLAVEIFLGKRAISTPLLPRERDLNLEHAQRCIFLIMEQSCGPLTVEMFPGKHCDFSFYLAKRAGAQSGASAEKHFPDYGTVLWSRGIKKKFQVTLRFQHLSCQESERSVWRMRRGAIS